MTARPRGLAGDLWGGLASMLVALSASLAFGVAIYAPLGPQHAGRGALAGATAIDTVAPILGGTERLMSGPCAPAAAVMGALALDLARSGAARARHPPACSAKRETTPEEHQGSE